MLITHYNRALSRMLEAWAPTGRVQPHGLPAPKRGPGGAAVCKTGQPCGDYCIPKSHKCRANGAGRPAGQNPGVQQSATSIDAGMKREFAARLARAAAAARTLASKKGGSTSTSRTDGVLPVSKWKNPLQSNAKLDAAMKREYKAAQMKKKRAGRRPQAALSSKAFAAIQGDAQARKNKRMLAIQARRAKRDSER